MHIFHDWSLKMRRTTKSPAQLAAKRAELAARKTAANAARARSGQRQLCMWVPMEVLTTLDDIVSLTGKPNRGAVLAELLGVTP